MVAYKSVIKMAKPPVSQASRNMQGRLFVFSLLSGTLSAVYARTGVGLNDFEVNCIKSRIDPSLCDRLAKNRSKFRVPGLEMLGKNVENVENERNWKGDWDTKMAADEELLEEGRKKDKGGGGKLIFLMAAASKATLMYFGLHVLAAIAGKALVVAKVALAIATAIVLKKALAHEEKTSYEIIKHPHHSFIQTHSSSVDYDHHDHGFEESGHRRRRRRTRR